MIAAMSKSRGGTGCHHSEPASLCGYLQGHLLETVHHAAPQTSSQSPHTMGIGPKFPCCGLWMKLTWLGQSCLCYQNQNNKNLVPGGVSRTSCHCVSLIKLGSPAGSSHPQAQGFKETSWLYCKHRFPQKSLGKARGECSHALRYTAQQGS